MEKWIPKWIAWEIIGTCNLNCIHCRSAASIASDPGIFDTERAKRFIEEIHALNQETTVVLTGGEPLLHKDWDKIALYGTNKGLRICIATNGTLVDDEVCLKMKDVGIKMVSLSLDGPNSKVHDDFRGQIGAFDGVMKAIEMFKKHDIPFLINSSFTQRNQDYIKDVYNLVKQIKPIAWYMFMIVPVGRGKELFKELIKPEDYDEILKWHFEMELEEKEILVRPTCAPQYYRICYEVAKERNIKYERRSLKFSTGGSKGCVAGQLIAMVDAYGNVKPCSYFPLSAGNIKETTFSDIWFNSKLFKDLRNFKEYKGKCGVCEYINVCGGCRARAFTETGDYMEVDPYCSYVPKKLRSI